MELLFFQIQIIVPLTLIVMLLEWGGEDCAHTLQIIKNHYKKTNILGRFGQNQPPSTRSTVGLKSEKVTASWLDLINFNTIRGNSDVSVLFYYNKMCKVLKLFHLSTHPITFVPNLNSTQHWPWDGSNFFNVEHLLVANSIQIIFIYYDFENFLRQKIV